MTVCYCGREKNSLNTICTGVYDLFIFNSKSQHRIFGEYTVTLNFYYSVFFWYDFCPLMVFSFYLQWPFGFSTNPGSRQRSVWPREAENSGETGGWSLSGSVPTLSTNVVTLVTNPIFWNQKSIPTISVLVCWMKTFICRSKFSRSGLPHSPSESGDIPGQKTSVLETATSQWRFEPSAIWLPVQCTG